VFLDGNKYYNIMAKYAKSRLSEIENARPEWSWKIWSCEGAALTCRIRSKKRQTCPCARYEVL